MLIPSVGVGHGRDVDPVFLAVAARVVELVRRDVDQAGQVAVISVVQYYDIGAARHSARDAQREVIRLRA